MKYHYGNKPMGYTETFSVSIFIMGIIQNARMQMQTAFRVTRSTTRSGLSSNVSLAQGLEIKTNAFRNFHFFNLCG